MNTKATKLLQKLADKGYNTEDKISELKLEQMLELPKITISDIKGITELQNAIKTKKVLSYLMSDVIENDDK